MGSWRELFGNRVRVAVMTDYEEAAHWIEVAHGAVRGQINVLLPTGRSRSCYPLAIEWYDDAELTTGSVAAAGERTFLTGCRRCSALLSVRIVDTGEHLCWHLRCTAGEYRRLRRLLNRAVKQR
ncbi:MAG: hypothetical protein ABF868_00070 [Sporolactobacillus sp.]